MKKGWIVFLLILILCGCKHKEKESVFIKNNVDYIEYRNSKIYLTEDFERFITQFKNFNCKFIPRNAEISNEVNLKDQTNYEILYKLSKGNSFIVTCMNEHNEASVNFTGYFREDNDEEIYKNKLINEWHLSSTSETLGIVVSKNKVLLGNNKYETVKSLKEKLGKPDSEQMTEKGNLERIIYVNDTYKYQFLVLNPINNNESNYIYNLYIEKFNVNKKK